MKFAEKSTYNFEVEFDLMNKESHIIKYAVEATDPWSAMVSANKHFKSLPQGAWMERSKDSFYWAKGNFFD